jgi:hypothetical protein
LYTQRRSQSPPATAAPPQAGNRPDLPAAAGSRRWLALSAGAAALLALFTASFLGFSGRLGDGFADWGQGAGPTAAARLPDLNCGDPAAEATKRASADAAKIAEGTKRALTEGPSGAGGAPVAEATKRADADAAKIAEATKMALMGATPARVGTAQAAEATKRAGADATKTGAEATKQATDGAQGIVTAINGTAITVQACGRTRTILTDARTTFTVGLDNAQRGIVNGSLANVRVGGMIFAKGTREPNGDLRALGVVLDP